MGSSAMPTFRDLLPDLKVDFDEGAEFNEKLLLEMPPFIR